MELCKRYKIGLIPFHFLHFGERLGVGAAGEVYKANYLGTPIAVKVRSSSFFLFLLINKKYYFIIIIIIIIIILFINYY